jgi:glutamyl-tRNA synthetase
VKDRCSLLTDFKNETSYFFDEVDVYDETAVKKVVNTESLKILTNLRVKFLALETWTASNVQNLIQEVVDEFDVGFGKVGLPLRLALTGSTNSPSIDLTAELLGKEKVAARIEKAVNNFSLNQGTDQ